MVSPACAPRASSSIGSRITIRRARDARHMVGLLVSRAPLVNHSVTTAGRSLQMGPAGTHFFDSYDRQTKPLHPWRQPRRCPQQGGWSSKCSGDTMSSAETELLGVTHPTRTEGVDLRRWGGPASTFHTDPSYVQSVLFGRRRSHKSASASVPRLRTAAETGTRSTAERGHDPSAS